MSKANLAVIGSYWHRIDAVVSFRESENPAFVPCILKYSSDLHISLITVLLLGSLGIGKRCFESRNNSTNSNPFADGLLLSRESSKVSFELPEGFSVTAEKWQQQGMFRVTRNPPGYSRKPCRLVAPPKSGNLFLTCGNRILFLVLDAVLFHLAV